MKKYAMLLLGLLMVGVAMGAPQPTTPLTGDFYAAKVYSNVAGDQCYFRGLADNANNDTFYVSSWKGFGGDMSANLAQITAGTGDDAYVGMYLRCTHTGDGAAPQAETRQITAWDASAYMIVVSPVFSASVAIGEELVVMAPSLAAPGLPGQATYSGQASVGALDGPTDSLYVLSLKGLGDDFFNYGQYSLEVTATTDGAAPQREVVRVTDYVSSTGLFVLDPALSANATALDWVTLFKPALRRGMAEYFSQVTVGALQTPADSLYLAGAIGLGDDFFNYGNYKLEFIQTTDGAAPLREIVRITDYVSSTGLVTVSPALSANATAADWVRAFVDVPVKGRTSYSGQVSSVGATPTDSFYVADLIGLGNDYFTYGNYLVEFVQTTDGAAPLREVRNMTSYVSSTGLLVVTPVLSADATVADWVVVRQSGLTVGQPYYVGRVSSGTGTGSVICANLAGLGDDYFNFGGFLLEYIWTTDGAAPINEVVKVLDYTSATGTITFAPKTLSASSGAGDWVMLVKESETMGAGPFVAQSLAMSGAATDTVFQATGAIDILGIYAVTPLGFGSTSSNMKWQWRSASTTTDLTGVVAIQSDAAGTQYSMTATLDSLALATDAIGYVVGATRSITQTTAALPAFMDGFSMAPIRVPAGWLFNNVSADPQGTLIDTIQFFMIYRRVTPGAIVLGFD